MAEQFVNQETGEVTESPEYLATLHSLEREIGRLDVTIAKLKGNLKAAKEGREQAVNDFRCAVREVKLLRAEVRRARRRGKGKAR